MKIQETKLPGVVLIEPDRYRDARGYFMETWHQSRYEQAGLPARFVQDNLSYSVQGVLRGLHFQNPHQQAKLVSVWHGEVFDVAVDIRRGSPTFGQWVGCTLSSENLHQLYIPAGFAHGFCVLSETALFVYKCSEFYDRASEMTIRWDDPDLDIEWPLPAPTVSEKDAHAPRLADIDAERLPRVASEV